MARCIICCFKCCLWCLEKFIKFLNRNAYIMVSAASSGPSLCAPPPWASPARGQAHTGCGSDLSSSSSSQIAIYGKNFCVSAKNAFMLLMRNIVRSGCRAPVGSPTHFSHPKAGLRNVLRSAQYHAVTALK